MRRLILIAAILAALASPAGAQGIRCSAFLHDRDGSWRSFETGTVLGPRGPIAVRTGERFMRGPGPSGEIAHALDALCLGDQ